METHRSGEKASNNNNHSFLDFNGILPGHLVESMEEYDGLLLTDLDCVTEHGWTCFATDNLWTSHDLPAKANLETLAMESPSELVQSQQPYVFGSSPQGGKSSGDTVKCGYSSEDTENMNEEDKGSVKSSQSARSSECRTLISERRRRGRLNERLYALRALVPKITKMDKASIVGDAISYVQDLQKQVKDIQAEISQLESDVMHKDSPFVDGNSVVTDVDLEIPSYEISSISSTVKKPGRKVILELDVSKVEESIFHLRIYCKKGPGVLIDLTKALESLHLDFQNANLTSFDGQIIKSAIIKMNKFGAEMDSEAVKRIILEAAANYGFETALNT
ncbi:hypothetical protein SUGI_0242120 [Cryptomeria japonica]|nr:hypothetical protein SUGI_0242120 [Cryptomeria japonica]